MTEYAILIPAGSPIKSIPIDTSSVDTELECLQRAVDGYFEILHCKEWLLLVNEEGLLRRNCYFNIKASRLFGKQLFGDVVLVHQMGKNFGYFTIQQADKLGTLLEETLKGILNPWVAVPPEDNDASEGW